MPDPTLPFRAMLKIPAVVANQGALTLVSVEVKRGAKVKEGQKLATLEGEKASIEFESPCDGRVREIRGKAGDMLRVNAPFIAIETFDSRLRYLEVAEPSVSPSAAPPPLPSPPKPAPPPANWTPRALKLAAQAGLDPVSLTGIEPTGPGGRISGDDVVRYLAASKG